MKVSSGQRGGGSVEKIRAISGFCEFVLAGRRGSCIRQCARCRGRSRTTSTGFTGRAVHLPAAGQFGPVRMVVMRRSVD